MQQLLEKERMVLVTESEPIKKTIKIGVTGMTCAACSSAVERALKRTDGVSDAVVSLATNDAVVTFDINLIDESKLVNAIEDIGYGVRLEKVEIIVSGMTCASCAINVESALKKTPGVMNVAVNLTTIN